MNVIDTSDVDVPIQETTLQIYLLRRCLSFRIENMPSNYHEIFILLYITYKICNRCRMKPYIRIAIAHAENLGNKKWQKNIMVLRHGIKS